MKKTLLMIALAAFSASTIPAQTTTVPPANGQEQQNRQIKQKKQGNKAGPQDGSGPIHTPGTGGGTGKGQRGPRR